MKRSCFVIGLATVMACAFSTVYGAKPNIVYILCDDLGYGDVQCLNPERGKIATPQMDRLASQGMVFTDAHSSSSVCTPTRYGILTGRYNWRTNLQKGVLWGYSSPLIAAERMTVAGLLKANGYKTACFGKWHLGMTMPTTNGILPQGRRPKDLNIVWDGIIQDGPIARGFETFYGISASLDMSPYIFIENDRFVGSIAPDNQKVMGKDFKTVEVLPTIGRKTVEFIKAQDGSLPFFVYVPFTSPHTPIVPSPQWQDKSGLGKYGDFVMQTDAVIGEIVAAVDATEFSENTLIIVTSDNGCSKAAGITKMQAQGHFPSAQYRGSKSDLWDGGHRIPFIVRWPATVKAGTTCDQTICLTDLMATGAELAEVTLPDAAGEDSVSFVPALKGKPIVADRVGVIHHSINGYFAYRQGKWKLLLARASGGWSLPNEKQMPKDSPIAQLYDMQTDPGETTNLYEARPEVAQRLLTQLESDIRRGCSTGGSDQANDVEDILLWKNKP
ncbi:arylsulfatase [Planctomycetota bacterium]